MPLALFAGVNGSSEVVGTDETAGAISWLSTLVSLVCFSPLSLTFEEADCPKERVGWSLLVLDERVSAWEEVPNEKAGLSLAVFEAASSFTVPKEKVCGSLVVLKENAGFSSAVFEAGSCVAVPKEKAGLSLAVFEAASSLAVLSEKTGLFSFAAPKEKP